MFLFIELVLNFIVQVFFILLQNTNHVLLLVPLNLMGQFKIFLSISPFLASATIAVHFKLTYDFKIQIVGKTTLSIYNP